METKTGGSWPGRITTVPNCDSAQQAAILAAIDFVTVKSTIIQDLINAGGELVTLGNMLKAKTIDSMWLDCNGAECDSSKNGYSVFKGNTTTFCPNALPPNRQEVTNSTLFHELVHQCGGIELDAWALEEKHFTNRGYSRGTPPQARYCETLGTGLGHAGTGGLRTGTFVMWNPTTGEVFAQNLSGGGWFSSATRTTGTRLLGPDPWWVCDDVDEIG